LCRTTPSNTTEVRDAADQRIEPQHCDRVLLYRALTQGSSFNQVFLDAFACGAAWAAVYDPQAMPFEPQQLQDLLRLGWQADCVMQTNPLDELGLFILRASAPQFCATARWPGRIPAEHLVDQATQMGWSVYRLPSDSAD